MIAPDHLGQVVIDRRRHAGHRDLAHARGRDAANAKQGVVELVEQFAHLALEVAADGGQRHAPRGALEQPHAEGLFELVDAAAERRLRQVDRLGRLAEVAELGYRAEGEQVVQVEVDGHRRSSSLMHSVDQLISKMQFTFGVPSPKMTP